VAIFFLIRREYLDEAVTFADGAFACADLAGVGEKHFGSRKVDATPSWGYRVRRRHVDANFADPLPRVERRAARNDMRRGTATQSAT
jgi:hypothetical protein